MSDISQIQVNGTTYDLCDATSRSQIANLQDSVYFKEGTLIVSSVPNAADTNVAKISLEPGIWIVSTAGNGNSSFEQLSIHKVVTLKTDNISYETMSMVRNTGYSGGDFALTCILNVVTQKTYYARIYQASGSTREMSGITLYGVRVK